MKFLCRVMNNWFNLIAEPAAIWDSSRPIVIGQARWSRGEDICTSKQEVVRSKRVRVACEGFFLITLKVRYSIN